MTSRSARACPRGMPGFSRAMTLNQWAPRFSRASASRTRGIQRSALLEIGKRKPRGMTPATALFPPSRAIVLPTIARSPPKRRCQSSNDRTAVLSRPGFSSSRSNARPSIGETPSSGKSAGDTDWPRRRSGAVPSTSVTSLRVEAAMAASVLFCARQSTKFNGEEEKTSMPREGFVSVSRTSSAGFA